MPHGLSVMLPPCGLILFLFLLSAPFAQAWDGFDADTAALIEVEPVRVPSEGDTITISYYRTDVRKTCLVEDVRRNPRTLELVVRCPEPNKLHTLVMDRI